MIVFGALLLLGGRLSDIIGQRRIFVIGFAILTAASVLAGLASSGTVLIAARALQGIGGAHCSICAPNGHEPVYRSIREKQGYGLLERSSTSRRYSRGLFGRYIDCMG